MTTRKFTHPDNAPEGHQWRTRDGREVTQLTVFDVGCGTDTLAGVIAGGSLITWSYDGRYVTTKDDHYFDLCDEPKRHAAWVNIYLPSFTPAQKVCTGCGYATRIAADNMAGENRVACVKIIYTEGQADD